MGEVLIYSSTLTTAQRQAVENYLDYKWFGTGTPLNVLPASYPVQITGGAALDLNGVSESVAAISDYSGSGGTVTNSSGDAATLIVSPAGASTFSGVIAGSTLGTIGLTVNGPGTQVLAGQNTYTGATTIAGGTLAIAGAGYLGGGNYSAAISNSGALVFNTSANQALAGAISGTGSLWQTGAGTLTLAANNTFTGPTNANAGTLLLNSGSLNTASAVMVAGGATFGGIGTAGTVSVNLGGTIQAGQYGASTGTLSLASLNFSGSGTLNETPATGYVPLVVTASNGLVTSAGSVTINLGGAPLAAGTYHLLQYAGNIGGSGSSSFYLGSYFPGPRGLYSLVGSNAGYLDLSVVSDSPVWTGSNNSAWDATTVNWKLLSSGGTTQFLPADTVIFPNTAATGIVNISASNVAPTSATFNNSTLSYTLSGAFGITDSVLPTWLTKSGTGLLTIANTNSFTGGVYLTGGTIALAAGGSLPAGTALTLGSGTSNGTFDLAGNNQQIGALAVAAGATPASQIITASTGSSTLTFSGGATPSVFSGKVQNTGGTLGLDVAAGTLNLSGGSATYAGATTVNSGLLQVTSLPNTSGIAVAAAGAESHGYEPECCGGGKQLGQRELHGLQRHDHARRSQRQRHDHLRRRGLAARAFRGRGDGRRPRRDCHCQRRHRKPQRRDGRDRQPGQRDREPGQ